jgi:hypothetical protein
MSSRFPSLALFILPLFGLLSPTTWYLPEPPVGGEGLPGLAVQDGDDLDDLIPEEQQLAFGFQRLEPRERKKVAHLLMQMSSEVAALKSQLLGETETERAARAIGWESAEEHLRFHGWRRQACATVRADGRTYFVTESLMGTFATDDLPVLLPTYLNLDGFFWCRPGVIEGIQAVIVDGQEHQFLLATWKRL